MRRFTPRAASPAIDNYQFAIVAEKSRKRRENLVLADIKLDAFRRKFAVAIPWFGWLMITEGIILLASGLRLGIGPFPFCGDVSACFLSGAGILYFVKAAR